MADVSNNRDDFSVSRRRMISEQLAGRDITDEHVLDVMARLPRHLFVSPALASQAYSDYPIGIGEGQTISQPYMVALMTQALKLKGDEKVLEIGTGCGYQTAVLASLVKQVYTLERIKNLALNARKVLKELAFRNIVMRVGDGTRGWPEEAPFDAMIVACGAPEMPYPLFEQLKEGGRMLLPLGGEEQQSLVCVMKQDGQPRLENLGDCRFVKLVGKHGWNRQRKAGDRFKKRSLIED